MGKFVLRNLKNERRKLDKKIAKLEIEEYKRINAIVIAEGTLDLKAIVNFENSNIEEFVGVDILHQIKCGITFKQIFNEITCIVKVKDRSLGEFDTFIGVAKCDTDTDYFSIPLGMSISQTRAFIKVQEQLLKLLCK